jgi:hypothetical protein
MEYLLGQDVSLPLIGHLDPEHLREVDFFLFNKKLGSNDILF